MNTLPWNPFRACRHGFHIFPYNRIDGESAAISPYCPECCPLPTQCPAEQHGDYLRFGYVYQLKAAILKRGYLRDCPANQSRGEDAWDLALRVREYVIEHKTRIITQRAGETSWHRLGLGGRTGTPSYMQKTFERAIHDLQGLRKDVMNDGRQRARTEEAGHHQIAIHTFTTTPLEDDDGGMETPEEALDRVAHHADLTFDEARWVHRDNERRDPSRRITPRAYMTSPVNDRPILVPQFCTFDWQRDKILTARAPELMAPYKISENARAAAELHARDQQSPRADWTRPDWQPETSYGRFILETLPDGDGWTSHYYFEPRRIEGKADVTRDHYDYPLAYKDGETREWKVLEGCRERLIEQYSRNEMMPDDEPIVGNFHVDYPTLGEGEYTAVTTPSASIHGLATITAVSVGLPQSMYRDAGLLAEVNEAQAQKKVETKKQANELVLA